MSEININQFSESLNDKADRDLNNLSNTGEMHFANPDLTNSPYTTNRILEIPQDIKLELNNGTLTLKAGSKVYVPNGFETDGTTPKFDVVVTEDDLSVNWGGSLGPFFLLYGALNQTIEAREPQYSYSGTTPPPSTTYMVWYDTANNLIKSTKDGGTSWTSGYSFPFCIVSNKINFGFTSIDQVFNGFGYIGNTIFALPGVKTVVPNGRNADGTCKNHAPSTIASVKTFTMTSEDTCYVFTNFVSSVIAIHDYVCSKTKPTVAKTTLWYNPETNLPSQVLSDGTVMTPYEEIPIVKFTSDSSGRITSFEPYTVDSVANSSLSNLTNGLANTICTTSATTESTASSSRPAVVVKNYRNGKSWYRVWSDGWVEQGGNTGTNTANGSVTFLIPMLDTSYSIQMTASAANSASSVSPITSSISTSGFNWSAPGTPGGGSFWLVCGQKA